MDAVTASRFSAIIFAVDIDEEGVEAKQSAGGWNTKMTMAMKGSEGYASV